MVETDIIIPDKKKLNNLKKEFHKEGVNKIHVLTDFDRTLTKAYVNGVKVPAIISRLRDGGYISKDYSEKAGALANYYHPIELDQKISLEEKKKKMYEWWTKHFDLLIKSGLNKKHIETIVNEGVVKFREGAKDFLEILNKKNIPLVIISSSGLGYESVEMFLEKNNCMYDNIHIISNSFKWDKDGNAIKVNEPIIHVFNKDEQSIKNYLVYNLIKDRKNIILLGDSLGDLGMITGSDYNHLIKVGFLNENVEENLELYGKNFDIVLTNDSDMNYLNKFMKEIVK
jgi:5'-nucleotidase